MEEEERGIRERERNEMENSSGKKEEKIRYVGSLKILLSGVFFFLIHRLCKRTRAVKGDFLTGGTR